MANQENKNQNHIEDIKRRLYTLFDSCPLSCMLWDREHRVLLCNRSTRKFLQLKEDSSYEEIYLAHCSSFINDSRLDSLEHYLAHLDEAFEQGDSIIVTNRNFKDAKNVPLETQFIRVTIGNQIYVASYARDLRTQNQLMQEIGQRDLLLMTINQISEQLLASDALMQQTSFSEALRRMGETIHAERAYLWKNSIENEELYAVMIHRWVNEKAPLYDKEFPSVVSYRKDFPNFWEILGRNEVINTLVVDMPKPERTLLESYGKQSLLLIPIFLKNEYWGILGFDHSKTTEVYNVNQISILRSAALLIGNAILRDEYIERIHESSFKLERALLDAKSASSAKTNFLANMSHEMRTPLNAVLGLSELVLSDNSLNEDDKGMLEKIYHSGTVLLNLVNDILDISKIEAGKLEVEPEEYDLASLINDTISQNIVRNLEKKLHFDIDIDASLPNHLYGDDRRIKQIISNLLSNAFKYTEAGAVQLSITGEKDFLSGTVTLHFSVSDTGIGIKEEDLANIFTEYIRLDTKKNRKKEGTGLGLPITKRLVELLGGQIEAQSTYGVGSTFSVSVSQFYLSEEEIGTDTVNNLLLSTYREEDGSTMSKLHRISLPHKRILVVDDNLTNLYIMQGLLKPYQMQVDCVTSGAKAIEAIKEEKIHYDAIFMDHMMPDLDGVETTQIIRSDIHTAYAADIPIIAFTANAIVGAREMFLQNGFQAFLSKPVDLVALDRTIKRFLVSSEDLALLNQEDVGDGAQDHSNVEATLADEIGIVPLAGQKGEAITTDYPAYIAKDAALFEAFLKHPLDGMDVLSGLKHVNDDLDAFLVILRVYADNTSLLLDELRLVTRDTIDAYCTKVHGIKSSSYGIGATRVGDLARKLEQFAKEGDFKAVSDGNPLFIASTTTLIEQINLLLEAIEQTKTKEFKEEPDKQILLRLSNACQKFSMDEVDEIMSELEHYQYKREEKLIKWLRQSVNLMNFQEIQERLGEYLAP